VLGYAIERKGSADFLFFFFFFFWVDLQFWLVTKKKFGIPERVSKEVSSRRVQQLCGVCRIEK
jgi:hypothetical protein